MRLFAEKVDGAALFADGVLQRDAQVVIARKRAAQTRGISTVAIGR